MQSFLEQIGVELPVVQAGMGGGTADHVLAAAVSDAGGLGTIGILEPSLLRREIAAARRLTGKPIAVNLLLPFTRSGHRQAAADADVVVTFWGRPVRPSGRIWIHQCGSVDEGRAARAAGVDAVIAQGVEAGGHVRGRTPALELLEQLRRALPGCPVLVAGGIAGAADVRQALEAGAAAAVAGTRFLLSEESQAHRGYQRRLLEADDTLLTQLFGLGWPANHRVIPNGATRRWLQADGRGPIGLAAAQRVTAPVLARLPSRWQTRLGAGARPGIPFYGPASPLVGEGDERLDVAPLYAGETVRRIADVRPAAELVRALAG